MLPDADSLIDRFRARAAALADAPLTLPACAPEGEFRRSPAAAFVGEAAAREGLLLFHFEHRVPLGLPEHWVPEHAPELAEPPAWAAGVLPEAKYQSFRHDLLLGSFHPGHRGKWAAHELCHALVGFAWRPGASDLFHATAGRLAELLPVALWYGFDEVCVRRCPRHQDGGALFRLHCPACEAAAAADPEAAVDGLRVGLRYLDAELAAVERTRRTGTLVPYRFATLDLCEDGVAYAAAHRDRLNSPHMEAWAARFLPAGCGRHDDLDALVERVLQVTRAMLGEEELAPRVPSPEAGRLLWTTQDVAWRMALVHAECEGEAADELDGVMQRLAAAVPQCLADETAAASATLAAAGAEYVALNEAFELALPEDLFAVGYAVPELPLGDAGSVQLLSEGLATCAADSLDRLTDARGAIERLLEADRAAPRRVPLARRWAESLGDGDIADLARYEAMLITLPPNKPRLTGDGAGWRLREGVAVEAFGCDVGAVANGGTGGEPVGVVAWRRDDGEIALAEVDASIAEALRRGEVPDEVAPALAELGVLEPAAWAE